MIRAVPTLRGWNVPEHILGADPGADPGGDLRQLLELRNLEHSAARLAGEVLEQRRAVEPGRIARVVDRFPDEQAVNGRVGFGCDLLDLAGLGPAGVVFAVGDDND